MKTYAGSGRGFPGMVPDIPGKRMGRRTRPELRSGPGAMEVRSAAAGPAAVVS
ncbi:MAG TPA: hypothetical protein PLB96_04920 [Syntrophales bacterium]|nr:hypothetical protein [Syntrophales bacterium]